MIHLRVSAKDNEALEGEVENLRQLVAELQAAQLVNPYEGEMRAMEEEMNKLRKQKEDDDRVRLCRGVCCVVSSVMM